MQLTRIKVDLRALVVFALLGTAGFGIACSSTSVIETSGFGGSSGRVGPIGGESGGTIAPAENPRCPSDPPPLGSGCSGFASICTFGPDTRDECAKKYACESAQWEDATGDCEVQCPKAFTDITPGSPCGDRDMACSYDEGTCGCFYDGPEPVFDAGTDAQADTGATDGGDAGEGGVTKPLKPLVPGVWKCVAPPKDPSCPSARPRVLDACVKQVLCDYGTCELGRPLSYDCEQGIWRATDIDTPTCDP